MRLNAADKSDVNLILLFWYVNNTNTQTYSWLYSYFHLKVLRILYLDSYLSIHPSIHLPTYPSTYHLYVLYVYILLESLYPFCCYCWICFLFLMFQNCARMNLGRGLLYFFWLIPSDVFHSEDLNFSSTWKILLLFFYFSSSFLCSLMDVGPSFFFFF